jgi:hypothetical protein
MWQVIRSKSLETQRRKREMMWFRPYVLAVVGIALLALIVAIPCAVRAGMKQQELNRGLLDAANQGDLQRVRDLLSNGADVNATDGKEGPALVAAAWRSAGGKLDVVKLLMAKGADVNAKTNKGTTALYVAATLNYRDLAKLLLDKGADVNYRGNASDRSLHDGDRVTALMGAAAMGNPYVAKLLLDRGADVNARTNSGDTALMFAAFSGQLEFVKLLLAKGADLKAKNDEGQTALDLATISTMGRMTLSSESEEKTEVFKLLKARSPRNR